MKTFFSSVTVYFVTILHYHPLKRRRRKEEKEGEVIIMLINWSFNVYVAKEQKQTHVVVFLGRRQNRPTPKLGGQECDEYA